MNNAEITIKYAKNNEEKLLLSRMLDFANRATKKNTYEYSDFLTPAERSIISNIPELKKQVNLDFFGGYDDAERTIAIFCPYDISYDLPPPITTLAITTKGPPLGHRDILGALMSLGIKREKLGDIIDSATPPILFCNDVIASYIIDNLARAGKNTISVALSTVAEIPVPKFTEITATVMTPRLDSIVAEGFSLSRAHATEIIKQGNVSVNWQQVTSSSKQLSEGDKISLRGMGKIRLASLGGQSKKGRTFIVIEKYV